jgi:hypothetical protein
MRLNRPCVALIALPLWSGCALVSNTVDYHTLPECKAHKAVCREYERAQRYNGDREESPGLRELRENCESQRKVCLNSIYVRNK